MKQVIFILTTLMFCVVFAVLLAIGQVGSYQVVEWTVNGEKREAIVIPSSEKSERGAPVLFVFHGHGGTMRLSARHGFQQQWKEAIIVCPQGLPTATARDPEGKRSGWQPRAGLNNDRDLKFFDAMLGTLREKYKVDDKRIYVTGHSNGGGFTYLLWAERGKELAAIAPSSCTAAGIVQSVGKLCPLPVLHLAGEKDQIVLFAGQKRTMEAVRRLLGCETEGKAWEKSGRLVGTLYPSKSGTPFVSLIHSGGHQYPGEAPTLIVKFFKELAK